MIHTNKPIIIYVDNLRRDYLVADTLRQYLEKKRHKVFLVSRINYSFCLKYIQTDLVIIVKNYFQTFSPKVLGFINKKTTVILVDAEGAQTPERCKFWLEVYKMNVTDLSKRCDKIFTWNQNFINFMSKEINVPESKYSPSGSSKVNLAITCSKFLKKTERDSIGIIGRFLMINDFASRTTLENMSRAFYEKDEFKMGSKGEILSLYVYLELIEELIKNTNYKISIRPHPNEKISSYKEILKKYPDRITLSEKYEDFIEWMFKQDKLICTPSTSIIEPIICKIPIISIHNIVQGTTLRSYIEHMLDSFLTMVDAPSNIKDLIDIVKQKKIVTKNETKEYIQARNLYYNIDKDASTGVKGFLDVIDYINNNFVADRNNKINFFFSNLIYLISNLPFYIKTIIKKNLLKSEVYNQYYDYNCFLIKKQKFAKKIASIFD